MEFKEYVEQRMKIVGISSFRQLAMKIGIAPPNIGRIMINPTFQRMKEFASALDCELWELLKPEPTDEKINWQPKKIDKKQIDQIFIKYSDGSADRFTRDPDVID